MKLLLAFLLFPVVLAFGQGPQSLQSATSQFYTAMHDIDIDALSQMLCAKDKEAIASGLDNFFLNEESKFRFVFTNAKYAHSPLKRIDDRLFGTISFRNVVRLTYFNPVDVASKQKELKEKYKASEVTYQKERNAFLIVYVAKLLAVEEANKQWKFAFLDQTLPDEISRMCDLDQATKKQLELLN